MHTASLGERVPEVASGAADPVLRQVGLSRIENKHNGVINVIITVIIIIIAVVFIIITTNLNSLSLSIRVVLLFPSSEVSARDSFVLSNKILISAKHLGHFIPEAPKVQGTWRKTLPDSQGRP